MYGNNNKNNPPPALRLLAALLSFLLLAPMAAGEDTSPTPSNWKDQISEVKALANKDGGKGTSWEQAILIASAEELVYFAQQVNKGEVIKYGSGNDQIDPNGNGNCFNGYYFALSADIDLKEHYCTPIGTYDNPFNGNFDGKGHCVNGLKVKVIENNVKGAYAGLFGNANVGTIQNVGVCLAKEGVRATNTNLMGGNLYVGVIAGYVLNVHNCYVVGEGSIEINGGSSGYAGGIVGYLTSNGSLTNCYATVDITIENSVERHAGGIVGFCNYNSTISCTYATGDVETGTGNSKFYAGGICGYLGSTSTIQNSLALNGRITGGNSLSNRIVGEKYSNASLTTNYASPEILVNEHTSTGLTNNENGTNTWLSSFEADLKNAPGGDGNANGWAESWDFPADKLPQLKKKTADGYEAWASEQPPLKTKLYLPSRLYIVSSTGGTLTVTDDAGNPLSDGSAVMSGTQLKLAYTEEANYRFSEYLSGSDKGSLKSYDSNSITMPDADLYLSATFTYQEPTPPYVPPTLVYYNVYLPQVEGASTDPGPGEHEVESWDDFRFYLTIDSAYSQSQPIVTTDRGETLQPRTSDGAYLVKYVRSDVEVFIDGLIKNDPVANEQIAPSDALAPQIWVEGRMLCIRMAEALPATPIGIYTLDGRLHVSFGSTPGLSQRQLPTGMYIVRVGDTVRKVVVR